MQGIKRMKRKKIVAMNKNLEDVAQDKLLQISILAEDNHEDQSEILTIEHRSHTDPPKKSSLQTEIQKIIYKTKRDSHISRLERQKHLNTTSKEVDPCLKGKQGLFISNKIDSNFVFVGFKNSKNVEEENIRKETRCLILEKKKRINTCPTPPFMEFIHYKDTQRDFKSMEMRKEELRVGSSFERKSSSLTRSSQWKTRQLSKENQALLRHKLVSTFYSTGIKC